MIIPGKEEETILKHSAATFSSMVEKLSKPGHYIENVGRVAEELEIDFESVAMYILPPLMEKLTNEANDNNLLKNSKVTNTGSLFG